MDHHKLAELAKKPTFSVSSISLPLSTTHSSMSLISPVEKPTAESPVEWRSRLIEKNPHHMLVRNRRISHPVFIYGFSFNSLTDSRKKGFCLFENRIFKFFILLEKKIKSPFFGAKYHKNAFGSLFLHDEKFIKYDFWTCKNFKPLRMRFWNQHSFFSFCKKHLKNAKKVIFYW